MSPLAGWGGDDPLGLDEPETRRLANGLLGHPARQQATRQGLFRTGSDPGAVSVAEDARINEFRAQIDAFEAEEAGLSQLLATRASRAAVPVPDPPAVPGGSGAAGGPVVGVSSSGFIWPVNGRLSSPFGPRWGRMHNGQDIAAPTGTPIKAVKAGTVIKAGDGGGYGNLTIIDHGGGIVTAYAHQSRFGVGEGAQVQQGDVIGYVGSTGHSTGPHLHFEVRINGGARNPRAYLL